METNKKYITFLCNSLLAMNNEKCLILLKLCIFGDNIFLHLHLFIWPVVSDPTLCILWSEKIISNYVNWYWLTLTFMFFVHVGIGLVWIGIISLGLTFLDDNTDMKTSPAVIGNFTTYNVTNTKYSFLFKSRFIPD